MARESSSRSLCLLWADADRVHGYTEGASSVSRYFAERAAVLRTVRDYTMPERGVVAPVCITEYSASPMRVCVPGGGTSVSCFKRLRLRPRS